MNLTFIRDERFLAARREHELRNPFPLLRELFAFADEAHIKERSIDAYGGYDGKANARAVKLPEKFRAFTEGDPSPYFVVAQENRQNPYFKEGTRSRLVRLSTIQTRTETNARIREIDLTEVDPSKGNKLEIRVTESINNQLFEQVNTATGDNVDAPHGQAKITAEVDPNGKRLVKTLEFSRFDEAVFPWGDSTEPVRWIRNLTIEKKGDGSSLVTYRDQYNVGRPEAGKRDKRALITTEIKGSLEQPESILVKIGFGSEQISVDPDARLQILWEKKDPTMQKKIDEEIAILKQDPAYAEIFAEKPDAAKIVENMIRRIEMLQQDWDKPQSIYATTTPSLEKSREGLQSE